MALVIVAAIVPVFVNDRYYLHILITSAMFSVPALGVRLVVRTGQWTFAQAGFMTLGAYSSGLLALKLGWPTWLTIPIAGLMSAALALIVGYPTLRIKGVYFAIVTMAMGLALRQVIIMTKDTTGGVIGIFDVPGLSSIGGLDISSMVPFYYFALFLLALTLLIMYRLEHSRVGSTFKAINQGDTLAEAIGINIMGYKVMAFVIASTLAGLAGALSAHYFLVLYMDFYGLWQSIFFVIYAIVGGVSVVIGPVIGSYGLISARELLTDFGEYQAVGFGVVLLVVIMFLPGGIVSLPQVVRGWVDRFRGAAETTPGSYEADGPPKAAKATEE